MGIIEKLHEEIPEINEAWAKNGQKVLSPVGVDTYYLLTNFPVDSLEDIRGQKIGVGGLALNWLKGTGAVPVAGALTSYYNSLSTGLYDGIIVFESAIAPYKFHEVAPYITDVGLGATYASALTVNLDLWNSLPEDLRAVMQEVALEYRDDTARAYAARGVASLEKAKAEGATFTALPADQKAAFAQSLPNIAREWADKMDAQGLPGTKTLEAYIRLSKEAGVEFSRDWLAE
ncbi:MAG: TRAP transporter substrate-binding protein DctP [Roseovarius sp.]|nr:TRAP transporter substrate-binding protein DctP [Roseovarius sp.]